MAWQPINCNALLKIIGKEFNELPHDLKTKFSELFHELEEISCNRNDGASSGKAFIIIRSSTHVLIFDDVEEEFGVARLTSHERLIQNWALFPNFGSAIRNFLNETP